MPVRNLEALDDARRLQAANHVPGYDWVTGRFGPPPGIPRAKKEQFDRMTDKEYLYAFLKLTQEEKESLMVSEAERRRTFAAHWPIESIVKAHDCAKEGFYYTGVADRVQCAFCGGIVRNWERGDVPKFQHKNFFSYCKMVQNKPCCNIPFSRVALGQDMGPGVVGPSQQAGGSATVGDLNINTVRPKDPALSVRSKRRETYRRYPQNNPIKADQLCDAGFIYEGIADKVKCFWCDGALEMWSRGDDPWTEHAKWYPGCTYVQQTKGLDFIRKARSQMTADNIATAETLLYNKGDVSFLEYSPEDDVPPEVKIESLSGYNYCMTLNYQEKFIKMAYAANENREFEDMTDLVGIVQELSEGQFTHLDAFKVKVAARRREGASGQTNKKSSTKPVRSSNVPGIVTNPNEVTAEESEILAEAIKCKVCGSEVSGAVLLPCGCFCLCQNCTRRELPAVCPVCLSHVRGACRTYLS